MGDSPWQIIKWAWADTKCVFRKRAPSRTIGLWRGMRVLADQRGLKPKGFMEWYTDVLLFPFDFIAHVCQDFMWVIKNENQR